MAYTPSNLRKQNVSCSSQPAELARRDHDLYSVGDTQAYF